MTLEDFINTYLGIPNVGSDTADSGQCVGLVSKYLLDLGLNVITGNAATFMDSSDPNTFDKFPNTPTTFPVKGDIFVCGTSWGNGDGHTGIIVDAGLDYWTAFEQSDPMGHAPQILTHNTYAGMLGWLRPKILETIPTSPSLPDPSLTALQQGFNALPSIDPLKSGNLEGYARAIVDEHANPIITSSELIALRDQVLNFPEKEKTDIQSAVDTANSQKDAYWQPQLQSANDIIAQLKTQLASTTFWKAILAVIIAKIKGGGTNNA